MEFSKADILRLTVSERIDLVEKIWDSIAEVPEAVVLTEPHKRELQRRFREFELDPQAGSPWKIVHERIRNRA